MGRPYIPVGDEKWCPHCGKDLPVAAFCNDRNRRSGLTVYCKACIRERNDAWRDGNPHLLSAAQKRAYERRKARTRGMPDG